MEWIPGGHCFVIIAVSNAISCATLDSLLLSGSVVFRTCMMREGGQINRDQECEYVVKECEYMVKRCGYLHCILPNELIDTMIMGFICSLV